MPGFDSRVMYVILRSDLLTDLKWSIGALATQAAHAATACVWTFREDNEVMEYMKDISHLRKVTLKVTFTFYEDEMLVSRVELSCGPEVVIRHPARSHITFSFHFYMFIAFLSRKIKWELAIFQTLNKVSFIDTERK